MKLITDLKVLQTMFEDGYVLHKPSSTSRKAELTLPGDMGVDYETTTQIAVLAFVLATNKNPKNADSVKNKQELVDDLVESMSAKGTHVFTGLRYAYLKEPECGAEWTVIHESNAAALRFETEPEKETYNDLMQRIKMYGNDKPEFDDEE